MGTGRMLPLSAMFCLPYFILPMCMPFAIIFSAPCRNTMAYLTHQPKFSCATSLLVPTSFLLTYCVQPIRERIVIYGKRTFGAWLLCKSDTTPIHPRLHLDLCPTLFPQCALRQLRRSWCHCPNLFHTLDDLKCSIFKRWYIWAYKRIKQYWFPEKPLYFRLTANDKQNFATNRFTLFPKQALRQLYSTLKRWDYTSP